MSKSIRGKLRGVLAAAATALCALSLVPGVALGASAAKEGGSLTVTGLQVGDTVKLYKVVDVTYDEATNEATYAWAGGLDDVEGMPTMDKYKEMKTDSDAVKAAANKVAAAVHAEGSSFTAVEAGPLAEGETFCAFNGNLTSGQYLVEVVNENDATHVYQNTIASVLPEAKGATYVWPATAPTVHVKSGEVTLDKKVDGQDAIIDKGNRDTVNFTITAPVPIYIDPEGVARTFTITDTMSSGITFNDDVVVKTGETELQHGTDYTLTTGGDATFTVALTATGLKNYAGKTLVVSYTGTVNENAVYSTAETNEAKLVFSHDSYSQETREKEDIVHVTVFGLTFNKVDAANNAKTLEGAEFQILKGDTVVATVTSDANGKAEITGALASGVEYTLHEMKAPAGYALGGDLKFTITDKAGENFVGTIAHPFEGDIVTNTKDNTELPTTGGAGTIGFTVAGVVLMALAGGAFVRSRKRG